MFNEKSCLILGPGRTGSSRLAQLIAKKYYNNQTIEPVELIEKAILENKVFVGRTYSMLGRSDFPNIVTIHSIRENVVDSILSRLINDKFELWKYTGVPFKQRITPFVAKMEDLEQIIFFQTTWYNHFRYLLKSNAHVVSYEIFKEIIPFKYDEELDKSQIILNYDEITSAIRLKFSASFLKNHEEFVDYKRRINAQEIYHLLQKVT